MLSSISWQQYFIFLIIATLLYYLLVWIIIYKANLSYFSSITRPGPSSRRADNKDDDDDELLTTAQHIIEEIKPLFNSRQSTTELITVLQQHLRKYKDWEEPGFRNSINNFIASRSESICSIHLSERDLDAMWNG